MFINLKYDASIVVTFIWVQNYCAFPIPEIPQSYHSAYHNCGIFVLLSILIKSSRSKMIINYHSTRLIGFLHYL